jgi:Peptidase M15
MLSVPSALRRVLSSTIATCAAVFTTVVLLGLVGGTTAAEAAHHRHQASEGNAIHHAAHHRHATTVASRRHRGHRAVDVASDDEAPVARHRRSRGVRVASLGGDDAEYVKPSKSLSGGGHLVWNASAGCLDSGLRQVLAEASALATIRVNSTCRNHSHNRAVGGAHHSYHLSGQAADFHVYGNVGRVYAFLRNNGSVGGLKHYGGGVFHIDTGPRRSW